MSEHIEPSNIPMVEMNAYIAHTERILRREWASEKDYESGFLYYGARYYWSEVLMGWLSVDRYADIYPFISPYAYCTWNPVILVDPNGMDTSYYNLNGNQLFQKTGGDNVNMMVLNDQAKMNEEGFKEGGYHSFDLATLNLADLDDMYDFSDKNMKECYYAIRGDGTQTETQVGTERNVHDALFDANNWQYNVHTHCKSNLIKASENVINNTMPSIDKDMVGIGGKFGIILGYSRRNMDAGSTGFTFNNGTSPKRKSFQYKREIGFYDSNGKIGSSIPYDNFKRTVKKIKTGR